MEPRSLPSTPFRNHYSRKIPLSDTEQSQLLETSLNKPQRNERDTILYMSAYINIQVHGELKWRP
jgi:hypothetical protein